MSDTTALKEAKEAYAVLGAKIDRLEAAPEGDYKPEDGESYYVVRSNGDITCNVWRDSQLDNQHYNMGNVYRTKAEAERARDAQIVRTKFRRLAKGFVQDWDDRDQKKWRVVYDSGKCFRPLCTFSIQGPDDVYFATKQDAEYAINELGDDLLLLLGGQP